MATNVVSTIDYADPAFDWATLYTYLPAASYDSDVLPNGNPTKTLNFVPYLTEGSSILKFIYFDDASAVAFQSALSTYASENLN